MADETQTSYASSSFLESKENFVVFISCIGGLLGAVLIVATVFFILETTGCLKGPSDLRLERRQLRVKSLSDPKLRLSFPRWLYGDAVSWGAHPLTSSAASHDPAAERNQDTTLSYINHIFSDIGENYQTDDVHGQTRIGYERNSGVSVPHDLKPSVVVAYDKMEHTYDGLDHQKRHYQGIKIPMSDQQVDFHKPGKSKPLVSVAMDEFNANEERRREGNQESRPKVLVQMEQDFKEEAQFKKTLQSIRYEHPQTAIQERMEQRKLESQKLKEQEQSKRRRKIAIEKPNLDNIEKGDSPMSSPKRRIAMEK